MTSFSHVTANQEAQMNVDAQENVRENYDA